MNWLKRNLAALLSLLVVLVTIDICIRLMFNFHLTFDSTNFNNIITPIATIISVGLFVWISIRQDRWVRRQNNKSHIEKSFNDTIEVLKKYLFKTPTENAQLNALTGLNFMNQVRVSVSGIRYNGSYLSDLEESKAGTERPLSYYEGRDYFEHVLILNKLSKLFILEPVSTLIWEISKIDLDETDRAYFKKRIYNEMVSDYCLFFETYDGDLSKPNLFIPDIKAKNTMSVPFVDFYSSAFKYYYNEFKTHGVVCR